MLKIRPYQPQDRDKVNQIAIDAFTEFQEHYSDWKAIKSVVSNMSSLASTSDLLVAEIDSEVVGAVALVHPGQDKNVNILPTWASIRMLVVSPSHRSKGIGKRLVLECLKNARHHGYNEIALFTSPMMKVALPMYLRMGFKKEKDIEPIANVEYALYKLELSTQTL
ncbi:GNAT family N-acetyltransferase [Thiomicrorhabdus xiamenensis]|uniref:GNAT family N-acetyltransferase n=1 Tax=Thiomicrorhabdus xiamenensis TaxID=2739063 RepID=A0A7D4NYZ9_9GAMM|nr:GNAT family N-acetyltransferase [Thiomicrorhabdus xiamenensis]QKI89478.1 GNAT family N-acetyltransferase [Thiomicrorhabdus xiamenensis]